jgi:hypothetical protein
MVTILSSKKKTHEGWRHLAGFVAKGSCAANSRAAIARPVIYDAPDLQPPPGPEHVIVLRKYLSQTKVRGVKIKMSYFLLADPAPSKVILGRHRKANSPLIRLTTELAEALQQNSA